MINYKSINMILKMKAKEAVLRIRIKFLGFKYKISFKAKKSFMKINNKYFL